MIKKKLSQQTAEQRAMELFGTIFRKLPPLARVFLKEYGNQYGICGEVILAAFGRYAVTIEKLPAERPGDFCGPLPIKLKAHLDRRNALMQAHTDRVNTRS